MKQVIFDCDYIVDDERVFRSPEQILRYACSEFDDFEDVEYYLLRQKFFKAYKVSPPEVDLEQIMSDRMEDFGLEYEHGCDLTEELEEAQNNINKLIAEHWEKMPVPDISSEEFCIFKYYGDGLEDKIKQILEERQ